MLADIRVRRAHAGPTTLFRHQDGLAVTSFEAAERAATRPQAR